MSQTVSGTEPIILMVLAAKQAMDAGDCETGFLMKHSGMASANYVTDIFPRHDRGWFTLLVDCHVSCSGVPAAEIPNRGRESQLLARMRRAGPDAPFRVFIESLGDVFSETVRCFGVVFQISKSCVNILKDLLWINAFVGIYPYASRLPARTPISRPRENFAL